MGSGKSSVGRMVAEDLSFDFVDTDRLIEGRAGMTITEMFATRGEAAFREWERQIVAELAGYQRTVIATGGGLPVFPGNLDNLKTHALVVCLWAGPETLYERVAAHTHRPLLQGPDPRGCIRELLAAREPHYRAADVLVNTENRSLREVASHVTHHLLGANGARP